MLTLRAEAAQSDTDRVKSSHAPDPDDNRILAIAIAGQANDVISSNKADILSLGDVEVVPIMISTQALDILV
jgi:predicted nucleic acid-binding protein